MKPIGILGGTFDPIHYGHLRLAEEMLELAGLQQIRFFPAGNPPHRVCPQVSAADRSAMVQLAIADHAAFVLDEREVLRNTKSFTVHTLRELRAELGEEQPLCLLMGGDAFLQLHTWHEWESLLGLAHVVVGYRPGYTLEERIHQAPARLREHYLERLCSVDYLSQHAAGGIAELAIPKLEISATLIRSRVAEKRTIRYLLPPSVANYIYQHNLYVPC
ncbi:MAG: nicotinate-nucleotide adenylyltransferase [Gallionella sp.]|nr:nicotinate-nucleotide adenylyltransferase [Gallionella sp.]MDD4947803.1 nicotinate-nucleotide adenylyltransferase [Gallionella sp.]MDD5611552.1 nicotinate-nucleotide adenylyltransferase [Gallionella sp.]